LSLDKTDLEVIVFPNSAKKVLHNQTGNILTGPAVSTITDATVRQLFNKNIS